jgi:hypothetical protein
LFTSKAEGMGMGYPSRGPQVKGSVRKDLAFSVR